MGAHGSSLCWDPKPICSHSVSWGLFLSCYHHPLVSGSYLISRGFTGVFGFSQGVGRTICLESGRDLIQFQSTTRLQSYHVVTRTNTGKSGRCELPRPRWEGQLMQPGCSRPCGLSGPQSQSFLFSVPFVDMSLLHEGFRPLS